MLETGQYLAQGRYRIKEQLNQGGMGTVYLATDRNLSDQLVAIKENSDTLAGAQAQFLHEAILLARLNHPNLPRVTDYFIEPSGRQYLVMDYVGGDDLRQILNKRGGPLPEVEVLTWVRQVMDALEYMHEWRNNETGEPSPIIHRDIKPSNIKLAPNGRVVLVDFGVAKYQTSGIGTQIGARAVTPGYSPIEQYTGGTDVRSDIYALGATLYTLLTNIKPPDSPAIASGKALVPPRRLNPHLSRNTERLILRAMQIQAAERYQTVHEMRSALDNNSLLPFAERRTATLTAQPPVRRVARQTRRSWTWVWGSLLALLVLLIFIVTFANALPAFWQRIGLVTPPTLRTAAPPTPKQTGQAADSATAQLAERPPNTPTVANAQVTTRPTPLTLAVAQATLTATVAIATPTPPPIPTASATWTPTALPTLTASATATTAPTATPDGQATQTALAVTQATPSATATLTPSPQPTVTATPTLTPFPAPSETATSTASATPLPTVTPVPSPTHTVTNTPPPTLQPTATKTPPATATPQALASNIHTTQPTLPSTPPPITPTVGMPVTGTTHINPLDSAVYVFVPTGPFTMGSAEAKEEQPVHTVSLAAFWIMQTEVTNAQYEQCVDAGKCTKPSDGRGNDPAYANHPVTNVSWAQATTYAQWAGGRLPTEAEWEKTARGTDARSYPWGNQAIADQLLNYNYNKGDTTAVGSYPAGASPYGALDMAGNVEEWVNDWYSDTYYASAPAQNPPGPAQGIFRVVRGGSLFSKRVEVRASARGKAFPSRGLPSIGFRVVVPGF